MFLVVNLVLIAVASILVVVVDKCNKRRKAARSKAEKIKELDFIKHTPNLFRERHIFSRAIKSANIMLAVLFGIAAVVNLIVLLV